MCPHTSHTTICVFEGELVIAGSQVLMLFIKLLYMSYFYICVLIPVILLYMCYHICVVAA